MFTCTFAFPYAHYKPTFASPYSHYTDIRAQKRSLYPSATVADSTKSITNDIFMLTCRVGIFFLLSATDAPTNITSQIIPSCFLFKKIWHRATAPNLPYHYRNRPRKQSVRWGHLIKHLLFLWTCRRFLRPADARVLFFRTLWYTIKAFLRPSWYLRSPENWLRNCNSPACYRQSSPLIYC